MPYNDEKTYLLVIKRNNNDYLPLEWHLTSYYNGENLSTIEGIDSFTSKITKAELLAEVLKLNMIDDDEKFLDFAIIYYEKGKNREEKEGTIFLEDQIDLNTENFINYIAKAVEDKIFLNQLYNACYSKKEEQALTEFKFILKNINYFINRGHNAVYAALSIFNKISYLQKRDIMIKVIRKLNNHEHDNKQILKKESFSYEGKVA